MGGNLIGILYVEESRTPPKSKILTPLYYKGSFGADLWETPLAIKYY